MTKKARKRKTKTDVPKLFVSSFLGAKPRSITRDEIYHRLEWYFHASNDPQGPHTIAPTAPMSALLHGLSLSDLYININKASQTFVPAWNSTLFHGVQIPWISAPSGAIGIKDIKTFGDLINCLVGAYSHAGWKVINPNGATS
jgi:hypothetical protein